MLREGQGGVGQEEARQEQGADQAQGQGQGAAQAEGGAQEALGSLLPGGACLHACGHKAGAEALVGTLGLGVHCHGAMGGCGAGGRGGIAV